MSNSSIVKGGATGQCLVFVTPDAERTMATNLGVSANLTSSCIDEKILSESKSVYLEGYLATSENGTSVALQARKMAIEKGAELVLTLSDASILAPFRSTFESFIGEGIEVLFCNEQECLTWSGTDRIDLAINEMRDFAKEIYITLGLKVLLLSRLLVSKKLQQIKSSRLTLMEQETCTLALVYLEEAKK